MIKFNLLTGWQINPTKPEYFPSGLVIGRGLATTGTASTSTKVAEELHGKELGKARLFISMMVGSFHRTRCLMG